MKRIKYLLMVAFVALMASCDDDYVEIDSLQVFGEEFFAGETVNVGMSVRMSDPDKADYYWECNGGTLLQRQGYTMNQWKAPRQSGRYTIKCTVTCGGAKETRQAEIWVNGLFFDRFGGTTATGWSNSNSATQIRDGRYQLNVTTPNATTRSYGEVRYNLNQKEFYPPMSTRFDCGIVGGATNTNNPKYPIDPVKFVYGENACAVAVSGNTPSVDITTTYFISEVRFEWWPKNHILAAVPWGTNIYTDVNDNPVSFNADEFDAIIRFQWTLKADRENGRPTVQTGWVAVPVKIQNNLLKYDVEESKTVGLAISEDYTIKAMVGTTTLATSDVMKQWRAAHDNAVLQVKEFKYVYPPLTQVYLDNVFFYSDDIFGGN